MSFLLDTDICSAYLKGDRKVFGKVIQHGGQLQISAVTAAELFTWMKRRNASSRRRQTLQEFLCDVSILDVTVLVSEKFGEVRAHLLDNGQSMPQLDLLIASTALVHDLTLVTHNARDYANVRDLRMQDWLTP